MADQQTERQWAQKLGGTVVPYRQTDSNCRGTVAWWLRRRLKSKDMWSAKYFTPVEVKGEVRPISTDAGDEKAEQLQKLLIDRGSTNDYITVGKRSDKPNRKDRAAAKLVTTIPGQSVAGMGDLAGNIQKSFSKIVTGRWAAKYSVAGTEQHAVGLFGCDAPKAVYFDPNLGEVSFISVADLNGWWEKCYVDRDKGKGAFSIFSHLFRADVFARI